jgi:hypothetical protein
LGFASTAGSTATGGVSVVTGIVGGGCIGTVADGSYGGRSSSLCCSSDGGAGMAVVSTSGVTVAVSAAGAAASGGLGGLGSTILTMLAVKIAETTAKRNQREKRVKVSVMELRKRAC